MFVIYRGVRGVIHKAYIIATYNDHYRVHAPESVDADTCIVEFRQVIRVGGGGN